MCRQETLVWRLALPEMVPAAATVGPWTGRHIGRSGLSWELPLRCNMKKPGLWRALVSGTELKTLA